MHRCSRAGRSQRGNILFLILLAVVLFAALSYAVTSSMRGGGKSASTENAELAAAEILQWFAAVDNAVMRMHLVGGIAYEDISFGYDAKRNNGTASNDYMHNSRCSTDNCHIFKTSGGGVKPPNFYKYGYTPSSISETAIAAGSVRLATIQWPGAGTDKNDIAIAISQVSEDICFAMKQLVGIAGYPSRLGVGADGPNPGTWDNPPAITLTSNANLIMYQDTFADAPLGAIPNRYCLIYRLVIER